MASPKLAPQPAKIIGFAYGTFDLMHDGHLHLLREARRRCDHLIVAIDSDRLAGQRKGPGRPVEDAASRSQNVIASGLAGLVLEVDSQSQLKDAVVYYQPDFLFAGDDGETTSLAIPGAPSLVVIPNLPGHSTRAAIKARLQ